MTRQQWADIAERVAASAWQGAVAGAAVTGAVTDWASLRVALGTVAMSAGVAVLSLVKGMVKARRQTP